MGKRLEARFLWPTVYIGVFEIMAPKTY